METIFSATKFRVFDVPFALYSHGQIDWTMWKIYDESSKISIDDLTIWRYFIWILLDFRSKMFYDS